jgi:hypothetical protein
VCSREDESDLKCLLGVSFFFSKKFTGFPDPRGVSSTRGLEADMEKERRNNKLT